MQECDTGGSEGRGGGGGGINYDVRHSDIMLLGTYVTGAVAVVQSNGPIHAGGEVTLHLRQCVALKSRPRLRAYANQHRGGIRPQSNFSVEHQAHSVTTI